MEQASQRLQGPGFRDCAAPLTEAVRRLTWSGGGVELIDRGTSKDSEFKLQLQRHAWVFSFHEEALDHELEIDSRRIKAGRIRGSSMSLVPAGAVGYGWGSNVRWHYLIAFLDPVFLARVAGEAWRPGVAVRDASGAGEPAAWHIARALRAECLANGACGPLYAETLGTALALRLLHDHSNLRTPRAPTRGALASWRLRRVIEHLHDRIGEPVTLNELAAIAGVSTSHFAHAFRAATGEPPHRFHLRLRLDRAKALLTQDALPLVDIALICGFPSQSHFTTVFRRATGMTPGQWRAQSRH